eukprot:XP_001691622.1 predicted protein [Chlamydomonas reinhardtii]
MTGQAAAAGAQTVGGLGCVPEAPSADAWQVDALRLDAELGGMLQEQMVKLFDHFRPGQAAALEPEVRAVLSLLVFGLSACVGRTGVEGPGLSRGQRLGLGLGTVALPTLLERLLGCRLVWRQAAMSRIISFEYLNRQLVWQELSEALLLLLPMVDLARLRRAVLRVLPRPQSLLSPLQGFATSPRPRQQPQLLCAHTASACAASTSAAALAPGSRRAVQRNQASNHTRSSSGRLNLPHQSAGGMCPSAVRPPSSAASASAGNRCSRDPDSCSEGWGAGMRIQPALQSSMQASGLECRRYMYWIRSSSKARSRA